MELWPLSCLFVLAAGLSWLSVVDFRTGYLPDPLQAALAVAGIGISVAGSPIGIGWTAAVAGAALNGGVVDCIGSDHAPHTKEEKARPYPRSPSGLTGVQTTVPLMLNHMANGKLTLERLVDLLCAGPARIFGAVGKGRVAVGYDGDFTVVDLKAKKTITNDWIASRAAWTAFARSTPGPTP